MRPFAVLFLAMVSFALGCHRSNQTTPVPMGSASSAITLSSGAMSSHTLSKQTTIAISGDIVEAKEISGIGFLGDFLFLVSNETTHLDILKKSGDGYKLAKSVHIAGESEELDLESIAVDGTTVYVIGSHSRVRPKQKSADTYAEAREKLTTVDFVDSQRDVLARFPFDPISGQPGDVETVSLRTFIDTNPVLKPFAALPSKENGVDIEGVAVKGNEVYVGFRGPVLRENFVPIVVTTFTTPTAGEIRFVKLGGLGVRDLAAVKDGFLILAGPNGDGPGTFQIYLWNGADCVNGATPAGTCDLLVEVPDQGKANPEGLTVTAEHADAWELVLVCDGIKNGNPTRYRLTK